MVRAKWFGDEKKNTCLAHQQLAISSSVSLSVETLIGSPPTKKLISVFEPNVSYYSRLGHIIVYNTNLNTWHCPCSKACRSCLHKYIAKWHLFQTDHKLFRTVFSREESPPQKANTTAEENSVTEDQALFPPPHDLGLKQSTGAVHSTEQENTSCPARLYTCTITRQRIPKISLSRGNYVPKIPRCYPS